MAIPDKLKSQAEKVLGEPVIAAAMVVPPGATLYKGFSPDAKVISAGGPIVAAVLSKLADPADGEAGRIPTAQGVLVLTADRVVFCKKKLLGVGVGEQLAEWPREGISFVHHDNGKWSYPGLEITFADGSQSVVFGESKWGLDRFSGQ
ncbi:MAG: hypothetical protein R2695_20860 [Acidimicrobiales bacterium]